MRALRFLPLSLLVFVALFLVSRAPAKDAPLELSYVEKLTGGAKESDKLPLVVALHGLGDTPEAFVTLYDEFDVPARVIAPRAPDPWSSGTSWYPFREPSKPKKLAVIRERAALLARFIEGVSRQKKTRGKAIATGFSQGGVLSHALAAYHPKVLKASLPIAGMLDRDLPDPVPFATPLPVYAFHGRSDELVPFADDEQTIARLNKAGRKAVLRAYEGVGHRIPPPIQRDYFAALREVLAAP